MAAWALAEKPRVGDPERRLGALAVERFERGEIGVGSALAQRRVGKLRADRAHDRMRRRWRWWWRLDNLRRSGGLGRGLRVRARNSGGTFGGRQRRDAWRRDGFGGAWRGGRRGDRECDRVAIFGANGAGEQHAQNQGLYQTEGAQGVSAHLRPLWSRSKVALEPRHGHPQLPLRASPFHGRIGKIGTEHDQFRRETLNAQRSQLLFQPEPPPSGYRRVSAPRRCLWRPAPSPAPSTCLRPKRT